MTYYDIIQHLIPLAKLYEWEAVYEYINDIGWEAEWMYYYLEDPDAEMLSVYDSRRINAILIDAFEKAHERKFSDVYRPRLLDI